jgi:hypothetical protein
MNLIATGLKRFFVMSLVLLICTSCNRETIVEKMFVGKWKSTKLETPVFLYENGEWEIKTDGGAILQYGVWQYKDNKIIWTYVVHSQIGHDVNTVLSATPLEFQIKEGDGSKTVFSRIDHDS